MILFLDVETTGTNINEHKIWSISCLAGDNSFDIKFNPEIGDGKISWWVENKMKINREYLENLPLNSKEAMNKFKEFLYDNISPGHKYIVSGYNVKFDLDFLWKLMSVHQINPNKYFYSGYMDVMSMAAVQLQNIRDIMPNFKLTTVCKLLDVPLENAHDSLHDIKATKQLYTKLSKQIKIYTHESRN